MTENPLYEYARMNAPLTLLGDSAPNWKVVYEWSGIAFFHTTLFGDPVTPTDANDLQV